jgi:ATP-dependent Clp protease adaptor protein ClpS
MVPEAPTVTPEQETVEETAHAPQWKVLLLDDDVTTFEFVIALLVQLFGKPPPEAVRLTFEIHETGAALVTVTTFERAELYVEQVRSLARARGFPLQSVIEPA